MTVTYEWDFETVDAYGDITDHHFADKLSDLKPVTRFLHENLKQGEHAELTLVRSEWVPFNPADSLFGEDRTLADRQWVYTNNGELQDKFNYPNGFDVPKRFLKEFDRNRDWCVWSCNTYQDGVLMHKTADCPSIV